MNDDGWVYQTKFQPKRTKQSPIIKIQFPNANPVVWWFVDWSLFGSLSLEFDLRDATGSRKKKKTQAAFTAWVPD